MKKSLLTAVVLSTVLLFSCSKEETSSVENANLSKTIESNTQEYTGLFASSDQSLSKKSYEGQTPKAKFDNSEKGLYRGLVAAKEGTSRGYLHLNIGNDGNYTASLKMADGAQFKLVANANNLNSVYNFTGTEGSLKVDLSDYNNVIVSDVVLNNTEYFGVTYKHTTTRMPNARTGTFYQTGAPGWNGTWNIIADGTIVAPNGFGGEGITSVLITKSGNMFSDSTMETFSFVPCGGPEVWIPTIGFAGGAIDPANCVTTWGQNTTIGGSSVNWSMLVDFAAPYSNNACAETLSGTYEWTTPNGNVKLGEIYADPAI